MSERKSRPPKSRRSDRPPPDLSKERDAFIETFFKKGAQLTQELIREHEELRQRIRVAEKENATLKLQVKSDEAIRELIEKIDGLEQEKNRLHAQFSEAEAKTNAFARTFGEVEDELSNLATLYVASKQLHSTVSVRGTIRQIKEMLEQLVGARAYAIYLVSDDGAELVPIASRGVVGVDVPRVAVGEGPIGTAFANGISKVAEESDLPSRTVERPAACVPLHIEERTVGVLALFNTFEQKTKFVSVDYEFFKLLAAQAASAIVAARLYADVGEKMPGIEAFLELGV